MYDDDEDEDEDDDDDDDYDDIENEEEDHDPDEMYEPLQVSVRLYIYLPYRCFLRRPLLRHISLTFLQPGQTLYSSVPK